MSLLEGFLLLLYLTLFVVWVWLLISVYSDIFRSRDLRGIAKAGWVLLLLVLPYLGVLIYLIVRGDAMHERNVARTAAAEEAAQAYIREVAAVPSTADELAKLAQLRDDGVLNAAEFEAQKTKLLA